MLLYMFSGIFALLSDLGGPSQAKRHFLLILSGSLHRSGKDGWRRLYMLYPVRANFNGVVGIQGRMLKS